jgi:lipoprotein NlpI
MDELFQKKWVSRVGFFTVCLLLSVGMFQLLQSFLEPQVSDVPDAEEPVFVDDFERGQYYFNADEDPSGPYDLEKAREAYTRVIQKQPSENTSVWYQLGRIDFLEGKFDAALYKFDKQIEYHADTLPHVYYMRGLTYGFAAQESGDSDQWLIAESDFIKYLSFNPDSPWGRTDLAWIYFAQGKYTEMLPVLDEGLRINPSHPWLLNMYGLALLNTGERQKAHEHFLTALEEAKKLTDSDWGRAYPGNAPTSWDAGLKAFIDAIESNIELTET